MTFRKKLSYLVALLSALFLLFVLIMEYSYTTKIILNFSPIASYPVIGIYLPKFIFWLSATIFCFVLVGGIIIIFLPITKKNLVFVSPNGTLNISIRSIENYILYTVKNNSIIFTPQINLHLTKKKLKIKISGYMTDSKNLIGNSDRYALQVQEKLNLLLGDHKMKILVSMNLKDYELKAKRKNLLIRQRVE